MSDKTAIGWTDATWNPVTGCSKVSPGCEHCYAEAVSHRFGWTTQPWTLRNAAANVQLHPERLMHPLRWQAPRKVFVNSMSDLFHPAVPDAFLNEVFAVMAEASHHIFQVLTKRPERMRDFMQDVWTGQHEPLPNVWLGVSCEDQRRADERIPLLLQTPAVVRFLSCEPLLGPVDLTALPVPLPGPGHDTVPVNVLHRTSVFAPKIHWVIVGAESGPGARPMDDGWVRSLRDQCQGANVPFFFKQRCHNGHKETDPLLDGRQWLEYPVAKEESV
jgi:protein gp37